MGKDVKFELTQKKLDDINILLDLNLTEEEIKEIQKIKEIQEMIKKEMIKNLIRGNKLEEEKIKKEIIDTLNNLNLSDEVLTFINKQNTLSPFSSRW